MGAVSYAYVAKLSQKNKLRIGGDLSFYKEKLGNSALTVGGQVDLAAKSFNEKNIQFDGDLGLLFEGDQFAIGATGYNVGTYWQQADKRAADVAVGQVLASYTLTCEGGKVSIQPLMAYKMFYKQDNIFTVTMQLE